jgi:hypothetical protein
VKFTWLNAETADTITHLLLTVVVIIFGYWHRKDLRRIVVEFSGSNGKEEKKPVTGVTDEPDEKRKIGSL